MQSPHDKLFQFAFRMPRHAAAWMHGLCPTALRAGVDWSSLQTAGERIPGGGLRAHFADAIFHAPFTDGRGEVWFVIEHKSYQDPGVHWQLLQYVVHLRRGLERRRDGQDAEKEAAKSFVALVLHHGDAGFAYDPITSGNDLEVAIAPLQPRQELLIDDLTQQDDHALRARRLTPLVTLVLLCLKNLPHLVATRVSHAIEQWADLMIAMMTARLDRTPSMRSDTMLWQSPRSPRPNSAYSSRAFWIVRTQPS